jgi:uncharacterized sodium:solute symporter family permease YidK
MDIADWIQIAVYVMGLYYLVVGGLRVPANRNRKTIVLLLVYALLWPLTWPLSFLFQNRFASDFTHLIESERRPRNSINEN